MADLRIIISGDVKNLSLNLNKATKSVNKFSRRSKKSFSGLGKSLKGVTKLLGPLGVAGAMAGIAVWAIKSARSIIKFDEAVFRLSIQANLSAEEQIKLRNTIMDTSLATMQSREEIVAALDTIITKTGDMKFAAANIETIARAATASGAAGTDLAAVAVELREGWQLGAEEIERYFNVLVAQGKRGKFTLSEIASQSESLFLSASQLGIKKEGLDFFGGLLQITRGKTKSAEEASTAMARFADDVVKNSAKIKKTTGFSVWDAEETKKQQKPVLKEIRELTYGLLDAMGGDVTKIQQNFGIRSKKVFLALDKAYKDQGIAGVERYVKTSKKELNSLNRDFDRFGTSTAGRMKTLGALFTFASDKAIAPALAQMSVELAAFLADEENVQLMIEAFEGLGTIIMGTMKAVVFLSKAWGDLADTVASRGLGRAMEMQLDRAEQLGLITPETKRRSLLATGVRTAGGFEAAAGAPLARTATTAVEALGGRRAGGRQVAVQAEAAISGATAQSQKTPQQIMNELIGSMKFEANTKVEIDGKNIPIKRAQTVTKRGNKPAQTTGAGR